MNMDNKMKVCPAHWPKRYNANNEPCDMIDSPCACGGWHFLDEEWVKEGIRKYGLVEADSEKKKNEHEIL